MDRQQQQCNNHKALCKCQHDHTMQGVELSLTVHVSSKTKQYRD